MKEKERVCVSREGKEWGERVATNSRKRAKGKNRGQTVFNQPTTAL